MIKSRNVFSVCQLAHLFLHCDPPLIELQDQRFIKLKVSGCLYISCTRGGGFDFAVIANAAFFCVESEIETKHVLYFFLQGVLSV